MRLTHAEDNLDDLHGGICHCGGGHGATGHALYRWGENHQNKSRGVYAHHRVENRIRYMYMYILEV